MLSPHFSRHQNTFFLSFLPSSLSFFSFHASRIGTCRIHAHLINDIFNLTDESTSCYEGLKDERDSARRENKTLEKEIQQLKKEKEDYEREKQTLQKNLESVKAEQGNQSSENLEAAKKEMRRLQGENRELKKQVKKQKSEFERRLKENLKSSQAEAKAKAVELQKIKLANKRLQEESNAERSKCDDLREEVRRLKEIMESYVL